MAERKTVLLIEDEVQVLGVMERVLSRFKIPYLVSETGRGGASIFQAHSDEIGVVILDDGLPDMEAYLVYDEIVAHKPGTPMILTSGRLESEIQDRFGPSRPYAHFLAKPFPIQSLRDWALKFVD
ncbi:response regulator [Myxococcota bacterium]|nr:response regulator [Myxococcota bacterium]MBU1431475.1 response regulator [Myxococcota bacterium]MBU1897624.1 response regulator [Myxococcota bacterium]